MSQACLLPRPEDNPLPQSGEAGRGHFIEHFHTADPVYYGLLRQFAKENKQNATEAESVLWNILRSKAENVKFRRQHIIGCFIADFVSLKSKLIVELDGKYHNIPEQQISDEQRTEILNEMGFHVIRFTNEEVLCDTEHVVEKIKQKINQLLTTPSTKTPPPVGEGREGA